MCDFREIKVIKVGDLTKEYNHILYITPQQMCDITEEGLYYICCTGSFYGYFDGNNWLAEGNGWEVLCSTEAMHWWA